MSIPELPRPIDAPARPKRLYSLRSIGLATLVGSCVAGGLIVALDVRALGGGAAAFASIIVELDLSVQLPVRASQTGTLWRPISVCFEEFDSKICNGYEFNLPIAR